MMSVSHLARFGFWTYFLLILARWKLSSRRVAFVVLLAAIHPASFFLAAGYSESLFYGALFGFVYWTTNDLRRWRWPLALAHGLVMSITRLPGAVACFCPVVACAAAVALAWRFGASDGVSWRSLASRVPRLALLGLAGSMGALAFLAWCQWTFGEWDIYLQSQRIVWHVYPDWWWWARWSNYNFWSATREWPDNLSRFCVLFTMLVAPVVAWREWSRLRTDQHGLSARLVLYLLAGALFTIHALGVSPIQMTSMLRYCLGPHLLLLLAAAHSGRDASTPWIGSRLGRMSVAAAVVALIVLQLTLASRFTHCLWVA
jgi:hypothetical protein